MTKSGFENDTVKKLINIVTITPLVIAGLYTSVLVYNFIFPSENKENSGNLKDSTKFIGLKFLLNIISILGIVFSFIGKIGGVIFSILKSFRLSASVAFILYLVLCYFLSKSYQNIPFLNDWSNYINTVLILIGVSFAINILTLFTKENNEESAFPVGKDVLSKMSWTIKESIPIYKSLLTIIIALGFVFLTFYLLKMFKFLSSTINSFLIVLVTIGLIFSIFDIITKNSTIMENIMGSKILQLLYHTIFIIPCLVLYLSNFIWEEIEDTPSITWILLMIQVLLIGSYFILPILKKWLFKNFITKKNRLFYEQENLANDRSIIMNENRLSLMMDKLSVDWDKLFLKTYMILKIRKN